MPNPKREQWDSDVEFYLIYLGNAIGYAVIWRFPYILYTAGGAAFFIPYFLAVITIGIPHTYLELSVGQYFRTSVVSIFKRVSPKYMGIPITGIMIVISYCIYLIMIIVYALIYLFNSFKPTLPWLDPEIYPLTKESNVLANTEDFFYNKVLEISSRVGEIGNINFTVFVAFICSWTLVYFC
jgi:SNF family Na+-dependent transporter